MSEKYYTVGTHTAEQWSELHSELIADGNVYQSVPSRQVTIVDDKLHSPTRGSYLLTQQEANELKADERVKFINLSPEKYPDIFEIPAEDVICVTNNILTDKWSNPYNNWQFWANSYGVRNDFTATEPTINRTTAQYRMQSKRSPWKTSTTNDTSPISAKLQQVGAGENVDIICCDNGTWIGHTEFINSGVTNGVDPTDYVGGNVLPGNGYCDVLDLVLDAPYYIDPNWFNASASTRLMTRWDGTTVPVESVALSWWRDSTQRSSSFAAFGNIPVDLDYNRDDCHGSNTILPYSRDFSVTPGTPVRLIMNGNHGTQCASLIYGRTHGWAYNANKWHLNLLGFKNVGSYEIGFDVQKVFHQYKPVNTLYNTKDPTMSSNSWGLRKDDKSGTHYHFRGGGAVPYGGAGPATNNETDPVTGLPIPVTEPGFISWLGQQGDSGRWKSELYDNSMTAAGDELTQAGVIFVVAAGNSNQQQVNPDHPNYDNRISNNSTNTFYQDQFEELGGYESTGSTNRRGFPQHIGKTESQTFQGNTSVKFPAINVGALDDDMVSGYQQDRKASYSDCGNAIDLFVPADGTLAATRGDYSDFFGFNLFNLDVERVDGSYSALNALDTYPYKGPGENTTLGADGQAMGGDTVYQKYFTACRDVRFSGTSAACPVACGFLAIVMQYNRGWNYDDLRNWIQNNVQDQITSDMYDGAEPTTATANWAADYRSLLGADRKILYQATVPVSTAHPNTPGSPSGPSDTTPPVVSGATSISVNENQTAVGTFTANEPVTWSISGGADQSKFSINSSGVVTFKISPDFESPTDSDAGNDYVVGIRATDAANNSTTVTLTVTVLDVNETPYNGPLTVNTLLGVTVSIASDQTGDVFFTGNTGVGEEITRLPPVYAGSDYSVSATFEGEGLTTETWNVNSVSATSNNTFTYNTSSDAVTITEQTDPYATSWTCLMTDLTTQTFPSEVAALAATDPSVSELISLDIPESVVTEETHTFSVGLSETGGATNTKSINISQANHFNATEYVSKVQDLVSTPAAKPLPPEE
jgi:hypothetical protein